MYSGTTLTKLSGRILGGHQKIDRVARDQLTKLAGADAPFPSARQILAFEGKNGPDAIKRKSPAQDEPWHYFNPFDETDTELIELIERHCKELVRQLKAGNKEKTAFEAAWLAHALVDGLTPAHHYPYEKELVKLRGDHILNRTTIKAKLVIPGQNRREQVKKNWQMWGAKGLMTAHIMFEIGIATLIAPLTFKESLPNNRDIKELSDVGVAEWFRRTAREVAVLDMYHTYIDKGWTPKLAWQVRHKLGPAMVRTVSLVWHKALVEAGLVK